jgi:Fe-S-cluster containining protein
LLIVFPNLLKNEVVQVEGSLAFRCNHCSECCKSLDYGIFVGFEDLKNWVDKDQLFLLGTLSFDFSTKKFRILSKKEFWKNSITNKETIKKLTSINPTLDVSAMPSEVKSESESYCVFYNNELKRCSIYDKRPLICRLYPIANLPNVQINFEDITKEIHKLLNIEGAVKSKTKKSKLLCPNTCFSKKIKPNMDDLKKNILTEQVSNLILGPYNDYLSDEEINPILLEIVNQREQDMNKK